MDPKDDDKIAERVVELFIESCAKPTPSDVADWVEAHPRHRDRIIAAAAALLEIDLLQEIRSSRGSQQIRAKRSKRDTSRLHGRIDREVD